MLSPSRIADVPRLLAAAFVLYGLVATACLAIEMPPIQNPDEPSHFLRAEQVADGGLIGTRFATTGPNGSAQITAGGQADPAMLTAIGPFGSLPFHAERRATRSMWVPPIGWSGTRSQISFPNTAVYPPVFYVPAAIGVDVGRATGLTVLQTLRVARLLTGAAAVAVGAVAIACAGAIAVWLFAILTLPMSLSLMASIAPDALMLACSALAAALLARSLRAPQPGSSAARVWLIVMLCLVATARPPYCGLELLPLALVARPLRWRIVAAAVITASTVAWCVLAGATALTNTGAFLGADPAAQAVLLLRHPWFVITIVHDTLTVGWRGYLETFIGRLGWLDTQLPPAYLAAATAMLGVAALATLLAPRGERIGAASRLVISAGVLLSAVGVFAIQYLTWTIPGHAVVDGVQGRYFLPLAMVAGVALPAVGAARRTWLHDALILALALFPVVSLGVAMRAIMLRYYLA